jgi:hypothetical protein
MGILATIRIPRSGRRARGEGFPAPLPGTWYLQLANY